MAEAEVLEAVEEGVVTLEEKHLPAPEETHVRVLDTMSGAGQQEDESGSVMQPLLQHKHQDGPGESRRADGQAATDGADPRTSAPQELECAGRDQRGCSGSARSSCSDSSRHECPICREALDSRGDHRLTSLNCNHALCHRCAAGIMRRAKHPGRLQCPFCRQTTPFPQWEIRRLQEESYGGGGGSGSVYEPGPALAALPGPELQAAPPSPPCCFALERQLEAHAHRYICGCCVEPSCLVRGVRLMRLHSFCFSITVLLLLFMVLLGGFLYMVVPVIMLSILFSNG